MTTQFDNILENDEDGSRVSTPIASHQPSLLVARDAVVEENNDANGIEDFSKSLASMLDSSLHLRDPVQEHSTPNETPTNPLATPILLRLPTAPPPNGQVSYVLPEVTTEEVVEIDHLPPGVLPTDISPGPDPRYIETSSGAAAREVKRRFDQHLGVGIDMRSPFVITAFINQHGKQRFRVSHRELGAPAVDAEEKASRAQNSSPEASIGSTSPQGAPGTLPTHANRRSRISVSSILSRDVGSILSRDVFRNTPVTVPAPLPPLAKPPVAQDGTRSPPSGRKLRKTRSIPTMASSPTPDQSAVPAPSTLPTGRPHAHSVSSVDAFRPPSLPIPIIDTSIKAEAPDAFASVMSWTGVPPSPMSSGSALRSARSFTTSSERPFESGSGKRSPDIIKHPFGRGVTFDTPAWPSPSHLSSPPVLREMQSFESGLTARADPQTRSVRLGKLRARLSDDSVHFSEEPPPAESEIPSEPDIVYEPLAETLLHSRYSTDLFDVLQNYKGLPVLDRIAAVPNPPTIKLSLKADETAAPRDDPRFVIWGEAESDDVENLSGSRSTTDLSSSHSVMSRRKSTKGGQGQNLSISDPPFIQSPSSESPKRVLVAATIERWIAQLTSELNYDELLIFFLTYRTYISALDLGHLLICRFHWALGHPSSPHDEMVRRIVRVRTFIAIRYWLLTFFSVDFVPNRELRVLFANWLNALRKDPILTRHKDATSIVQKLRKVVLDCKEAHTHGNTPKRQSAEKRKATAPTPTLQAVDLSGGNFAEALRKAVGKDVDDTDIDLDFDDVDASGVEFGINAASHAGNPATAVDLAMLRQPLHLAFLQYGKSNVAAPQLSTMSSQIPLPVPHSTISRVVVNAIGRLGRWKRVMNYRATGTRAPIRPPLGLSAACVDASNFDLEANETGDLLMVRGGVEHYLKMVESQMSRKGPTTGFMPRALQAPTALGLVPSITTTYSDANSPISEDRESLEPVTETSDEGVATDEGVVIDIVQPSSYSPPASERASEEISVRSSIRSSVQSEPELPQRSTQSPADPRVQMDVVSIDDLDLSDLSSEDLHVPPPPGLRRLPRRLPNRRDFELVRHSVDSVSSMGIRTHDSVLSAGSSVVSSMSLPATADAPGPIHQWQMNALIDSLSDEDEEGDVEAALRRLEGQINQDRQKQKQTKVDGWVQSIRERLANGQFGTVRRYSSDEEDYGEVTSSLRDDDRAPSRNSVSRASVSHVSSRNSVSSVFSPFSIALPSENVSESPASQILNQSSPDSDAKPAPEGVAPPDIIHSRVSSRPSTSAGAPPSEKSPPLPINALTMVSDAGAFGKPEKSLKRHRSFILSYKSDFLAKHFAAIDRELFLSLKFEELVSQDWMASSDDLNVLDWSQYLRDRARLKAEGHDLKTSALKVVRSRFNLMVNFVVSEIILTHPSERLMIHSKFVRIAWKSYIVKSFNTLVAILAGLDNTWVKRALQQTHAKLGIWENRMLRDLQQWCTHQDDFKHIRQTIDALAEAKTRTVGSPDTSVPSTDGQSNASRSRAASEGKPPPPPSCVPFFGVYLSQLYRYSNLPDLIDPTAPHEPVAVDPVTNTFEAPAHPQVFSYLTPLPPSVQLEPLINVHKQRLVAGVVKSLVAGQHLATRVDYTIDKKLFQKCLKLRGLDQETLQRVLTLYSNWVS